MGDSVNASGETTPSLAEGARNAWRLMMILRPYWRRLFRMSAMGLIIGLLALVTPLFAKMLFDEAYPNQDPSLMHVLVLAAATAAIASAFMGAIRGYFGQVLAARMSPELNLMLFNHVLHLETQFFDSRRTGDILSRSGDLQRSVGFISSIVQTTMLNGIYILLIPPVLFALDWRLAILAIAAVPLSSSAAMLAGGYTRILSRKTFEASAEVSGYQTEVIMNVRVIRSATAESDVIKGMQTRLRRVRDLTVRTSSVNAALSLFTGFVRAAGAAAYAWYGWTLVLRHELSLGSFMAFSGYLAYLTGPVGQLASTFTSLQQTSVSLGRLFEYLDMPTEADLRSPMAARHHVSTNSSTAVRFRNVDFSYVPDRSVLIDASLEIESGGVVALVGKSGSGKSSLVKLLLRMYEPQRGSITIGDEEIHRLPLQTLRERIGVVWQDNGVFRGTLRDNLLLGAGEVTAEDVSRAVTLASLDAFVATLPDGLDTSIAESGCTLSAGQRQRLAVARALLRKSSILIFDEATANLDPETERHLLESVLRAREEQSLLLITHRVASARIADRVYMINNGAVTGGLSHHEMLSQYEAYRALWGGDIGIERNVNVHARVAEPLTERISPLGLKHA